MKSSTLIFGAAVLLCLGSVSADTYTEVGDAGHSIATAQLVAAGGTPLTAIIGGLGASQGDMFGIYLTGGMTFSATTSASSSAYNAFDTQLFLFDSAGIGVYANDDDDVAPPQSTLGASLALTPAASGLYYLAISGSGFLPFSPGGYIFPVLGGLLDQGLTGDAVGPTGPGGASALSGWASVSGETGAYEIKLTGAEFSPSTTAPIPEPGSVLLMATALCSFGLLRMRSRRV